MAKLIKIVETLVSLQPLFALDADRYFAVIAEMSHERFALHLFSVPLAAAGVYAPDVLCAAEQLYVSFVADVENHRPVRNMLPIQ